MRHWPPRWRWRMRRWPAPAGRLTGNRANRVLGQAEWAEQIELAQRGRAHHEDWRVAAGPVRPGPADDAARGIAARRRPGVRLRLDEQHLRGGPDDRAGGGR